MASVRARRPTSRSSKEHNLNDPLLVQYGKYVGKLVQGDLGTNFYGIPVKDELAKRYVTTGKLAMMAILWETLIGISAGVLAGIRKGRFIDNLVLVSTLFVISIPVFVIGATAQMFLGVRWGIFPVTVSAEATFYELLLRRSCWPPLRWRTSPSPARTWSRTSAPTTCARRSPRA